MTGKENDLTKGNLWKGILLFSLPLILSNLLQVLFNMADVAVVGRYVGDHALGAVGSTVTLVAIFTGLVLGLGNGVNAFVARFLGAGNHAKVKETVQSSFLVCLLGGLLIGALGVGLAPFLLSLMGTKEELIADASLYLRIYFCGIPALSLYNYGCGILSAAGDTKRPLYCLTLAGILNVALNLLFVLSFNMGVCGVAVASIISQYLSAVLVLAILLHSKEAFALTFYDFSPRWDSARGVLSLGIPTSFQYAIFNIANSFIMAGVNTFDTVMVEGNAAALNADGIVYDAMAAFYTACSSFMAQNFGAGHAKRVRQSYYISVLYSFLTGALLGVGLFLCGRPFLSLFTTSTAVMDAGMKRLTVMGFSYAVSAFMDCTIAASRGLGKSLVPMVIVILGSCVFRVIWVYTVFAFFHTFLSLYLLYVFSWTITATAEILYFKKIYRQQIKEPL